MSKTSSETRKTKVSFNSQVKVIGTLHLNDYTREEIQRYWHSNEELRTNYERRRRKRIYQQRQRQQQQQGKATTRRSLATKNRSRSKSCSIYPSTEVKPMTMRGVVVLRSSLTHQHYRHIPKTQYRVERHEV